MSNSYYSDYLMTPHWKQKREERLNIDAWECQFCGSTSDLHIHHLTYERKGREDVKNDLITLCKHCHGRLHKQVEMIDERSNELQAEIEAEIEKALEPIKQKFVTKQGLLIGEILGEYEQEWGRSHVILKTIRETGKFDWMSRPSTKNVARSCKLLLHNVAMKEGARFKRANAKKRDRGIA